MSSQIRSSDAQSLIRADTPYPAVLLIGRLDAGAGGVASFDFTAIPAIYSKLIIDLFVRGDTAATNVAVNLTFNGDAGNNYDYFRLNAHYNAAFTSNEGLAGANISLAAIAAATAPADAFDFVRIEIPAYAQTNGHKAVLAQNSGKLNTTSTNLYYISTSGWYRSANAITQATLTPGAGAFAQYSTARLYGVY